MFEMNLALDNLYALLPSPKSFGCEPMVMLQNHVEGYINKLHDTSLLADLTGVEVYEAFSLCCVDAINNIAYSIATDVDSSRDTPTFSVLQEKKLIQCLEFIVCFGIYPLLDPNVGRSLKYRLEYFKQFNCPRNNNCSMRISKLMKIAKCLLLLKNSKCYQLNLLVCRNKFFGDLVVVLIQLGYGMDSYLCSIESDTQVELFNSFTSATSDARDLLWNVLLNLPLHISFKEILILQAESQIDRSESKISSSTPAWLQKACGYILSRLLVDSSVYCPSNSPDLLSFSSPKQTDTNVYNLLIAAVDLTPGILSSTGLITEVDPRKQPHMISTLAHILSTPPNFMCQTDNTKDLSVRQKVGNFYLFIGKQILHLLKQGQISTHASDFEFHDSIAFRQFANSVAIQTVHEICKKCPKFGAKSLLWPLVGVLKTFCQIPHLVVTGLPVEKPNPELELATEGVLSESLKYFSDLLDCAKPSRFIATEMCKLSNPIFMLFTQVLIDESNCINTNVDKSPSKIFLLDLLSRLLTIGCNSNQHRVALIRSWFGLPATSSQENDIKPTGASKLTNGAPISYPCRDGLSFKPIAKVQRIDPCTTSSSNGMEEKPTKLQIQIPYCCTLSADPNNKSLYVTFSVNAVVELLSFMFVKSGSDIWKPDDDKLSYRLSQLLTVSSKNEVHHTQSLSDNTLASDLFISLIQDMNYTVFKMIEQAGNIVIPRKTITPSDKNVEKSTELGLTSSLLASAMLDNLGDLVWPQDLGHVIDLFELTLRRFNSVILNTDKVEVSEFICDTLSQLLGILAFYINNLGPIGEAGNSRDRDEFSRLIPSLNKLEQTLTNEQIFDYQAIINLLNCLHISLATRGAIQPSSTTVKSLTNHTTHLQPDLTKSKRCLEKMVPSICVRNSKSLITEVNSSGQSESDIKQEMPPMSPYMKSIYDQLNDPLIPVRGHALILLARLLENCDAQLSGHENDIFQLLIHHMKHTDSYIYLNAIRCLSAMGQAYTDKFLRALLTQFSSQLNKTDTDSNHDDLIEYSLKLGETVMRILRKLGEMAPFYLNEVLNTFTVGSHHKEPLIRAASLSNIAELVHFLGYAIKPVIYEIFSLIELHLTQDVSPVVRDAAAYLCGNLFHSESSLPPWIPMEVLRDLNRLLTHRQKVERDSTVSQQIESALAKVYHCTRESVFLKPDSASSLIKHINILGHQ